MDSPKGQHLHSSFLTPNEPQIEEGQWQGLEKQTETGSQLQSTCSRDSAQILKHKVFSRSNLIEQDLIQLFVIENAYGTEY